MTIEQQRDIGRHFGPLHKHPTYAVPRRGDLDDVVGKLHHKPATVHTFADFQSSTRTRTLDLISTLSPVPSSSTRTSRMRSSLQELPSSACTLPLKLETIRSGHRATMSTHSCPDHTKSTSSPSRPFTLVTTKLPRALLLESRFPCANPSTRSTLSSVSTRSLV